MSERAAERDHKSVGIDDAQSHLYKEYDRSGRNSNSFMQRAALTGIKNLDSQSYKKDTPIMSFAGRFPEKYQEERNHYVQQENFEVNEMLIGDLD